MTDRQKRSERVISRPARWKRAKSGCGKALPKLTASWSNRTRCCGATAESAKTTIVRKLRE